MKTLLAVINEPDNSKEFIKYAAQLAKDLNTNLTLLAVQNPEAYPMGAPDATGATTVHIQKGLEEIAKKAKENLLHLSQEVISGLSFKIGINVLSEIGITKFIVQELVSNNQVDMVILNSKVDVSFWAQNSTNMDIIFDVNCPVWVIPADINYMSYSKVVYATNYKEEDIATMKRFLKLLQSLNPEIVALHITDTTDFEEKVKTTGFLDAVKEKTGYNNVNVKAILERENDDVAQLINDYSSDIDANLVVTLKENRHFLERLFKPSSTKKLIKEAKLPVLVFHEKEE